MKNKAISLVGIMGVGKTCIAKKLSKKLNLPCIDTDKEIKNITKKSIKELIQNNQEDLVKKIEYEIIKEYSNKNCIISTGDSTINNQAAWDFLLNNTISVWMNIAISKIAERLRPTENRPLFQNEMSLEELQKIYNRRKKRYKHAKIELKNLNKKTIEKLIETIKKMLAQPELISNEKTIIASLNK